MERPRRALAVVAHLIGLFLPVLGPGAVWAASPKDDAFTRRHARMATLGSATLSIILFVSVAVLAWQRMEALATSNPDMAYADVVAALLQDRAIWTAFGGFLAAHLVWTGLGLFRALRR